MTASVYNKQIVVRNLRTLEDWKAVFMHMQPSPLPSELEELSML